MNLKTASDFEINKAVAESLGYSFRAYGGHIFIDDIDFGPSGVDYCNQIEDAWPIIHDNHIGMLMLLADGITSGWMALKNIDGDEYHSFNDNPIRAAMEIFLMVKGIGS